jgi:hypothetical protein
MDGQLVHGQSVHGQSVHRFGAAGEEASGGRASVTPLGTAVGGGSSSSGGNNGGGDGDSGKEESRGGGDMSLGSGRHLSAMPPIIGGGGEAEGKVNCAVNAGEITFNADGATKGVKQAGTRAVSPVASCPPPPPPPPQQQPPSLPPSPPPSPQSQLNNSHKKKKRYLGQFSRKVEGGGRVGGDLLYGKKRGRGYI